MEKFASFTMVFCWEVKNDEYNITIVKEEVLDSELNQESLEDIIKKVFNQTNNDNFEEFAVMFASSLKHMVHRYYTNQPMEMIEQKMLRRFFEGDVICRYRWLPDSVLFPKLDCISRFRAPYNLGFKSHYLQLPTL